MIDLKNTYIENDFGELRDAYFKAVSDCGGKWSNGGSCLDEDEYYDTDDGCIGFDSMGLGTADAIWFEDNGYKQITLADLKPAKPRTRVEYIACKDSIFDLKAEFEAGELYFKWLGNPESKSGCGYDVIGDEANFADKYAGGVLGKTPNVYRRVEREVSWQEEVKDYLAECTDRGCSDDDWLLCKNEDTQGFEISDDEFIKMCHLVASMTDKPE